MNKVVKTILLVLLAIIALLLLLYFLSPGTVADMSCSALSGSDQDHCYKFVAEKRGDPSICAKIKGVGDAGIAPKAQCYEDIAVASKDITVCEMINDISMISTDPNRCSVRVVRTAGNKALCGQLKDPDTRTHCEAV